MKREARTTLAKGAPKKRKPVKIEELVHARLKQFAQNTGMKIEALAQRYIEAGLNSEGVK